MAVFSSHPEVVSMIKAESVDKGGPVALTLLRKGVPKPTFAVAPPLLDEFGKYDPFGFEVDDEEEGSEASTRAGSADGDGGSSPSSERTSAGSTKGGGRSRPSSANSPSSASPLRPLSEDRSPSPTSRHTGGDGAPETDNSSPDRARRRKALAALTSFHTRCVSVFDYLDGS